MSSTSTASIATASVHAAPQQIANANRALFLGGFATFMTLYFLQPLLPLFSNEFQLSPAQSSWSLSISTAAVAIFLLPSSVLSDRIGRTTTMTVALFLSAIGTIACAAVDSFAQLVILRGLQGIAVAGVPAVAMTYLNEEIEPKSLGFSMGLYIAGSALGGMAGRFAASMLADHFSWRTAMAVVGAVALLMAIEFKRRLPPSRHFRRRDFDLRETAAAAGRHLSDGGLPRLFIMGFLLMGAFVSVYNYLGYRLLAPRFGLSHTSLSFIFTLYVVGMFSSVAMGKLADRVGRRQVLWIAVLTMLAGLLLTLPDNLVAIIAGVALLTFGFFGAHSVASSWVGRRATEHRALAAAIYLFAYYLGSSVVSPLAGSLWQSGGWNGIAFSLAACLCVCLFIAFDLRRLPMKV